MPKTIFPTVTLPKEVLENLVTVEGKEGGYYTVAHQSVDVMSVIVKDNKLVQVQISEEVQAQTTTFHPVGSKVWCTTDGKFLSVEVPSYVQSKSAETKGSAQARQQA
jgi:hypothetical protein